MVGKDERRKEGQMSSGVGEEPAGGLALEIGIEVKDKHGKVIKSFTSPGHTFTKSFYNVLSQMFAHPCDVIPNINILATDNVAYLRDMSTLDTVGDWCDVGVATEDTHGILVGSSATAWAFGQYDLQAKIAHGTGTGQLSYGATGYSCTPDTGAPAKVTLTRSFDNTSGDSITVREIGWFGKMKTDVGVWKYHMTARDVITATAVPNGGRLTVTYNILINPT